MDIGGEIRSGEPSAEADLKTSHTKHAVAAGHHREPQGRFEEIEFAQLSGVDRAVGAEKPSARAFCAHGRASRDRGTCAGI